MRITDTENASHILGRIEVTNLAYQFSSTDPAVFEGVNFVVERGETIAIVGPSGCGKSTLMKCMMGLLNPTEGTVSVDGVGLNTQPDYRSNIAGVMQDDKLLAGTILDNITMFSSTPDYKKLAKCAEMACINNDINQMAMGYNTLVGDMGGSLSGGQKQRIFLARAFYREPQILSLIHI